MSLIRLYVHHEKVVLPKVAETEAGFYVDIEPIQVFAVSQMVEWKKALYSALMDGNVLIPTPERSDEPGSAILEKLKIQKWSTFEMSSIMYTVHSGGGTIRVYRTGKGSDGKWTTETNERQFASRTPMNVIVDAVSSDLVKQPEANRPKTGLMLAPPSSSS